MHLLAVIHLPHIQLFTKAHQRPNLKQSAIEKSALATRLLKFVFHSYTLSTWLWPIVPNLFTLHWVLFNVPFAMARGVAKKRFSKALLITFWHCPTGKYSILTILHSIVFCYLLFGHLQLFIYNFSCLFTISAVSIQWQLFIYNFSSYL